MKQDRIHILIAAFIAIAALFISQAAWLSYASRQEKNRNKEKFASNFRESIATLIKISWGTNSSKNPYEIEPVSDEQMKKYKKDGKKIRETNAGNFNEECMSSN